MLKSVRIALFEHAQTLLNDDERIKAYARILYEQANRVRMTEEQRYELAERLTYAIYPRFRFSEFGRIFLDDSRFLSYYERFMDVDNWHSYDRKWMLKELLGLVVTVPGDLAECGVYKGATAFLMCELATQERRQVFLFDSFRGLSAPGAEDGDYWRVGDLAAGEHEVSSNLNRFNCFKLFPGWIPDRFDEVASHEFSFCHIDVDLYQPTLDTLKFFYPRMQSGGVLLFDDYGFRSCPGARQAIDEFFTGKPERIVMVPTGQAFVIRAQT